MKFDNTFGKKEDSWGLPFEDTKMHFIKRIPDFNKEKGGDEM